jgi:hypothetical protein
MCDEQVSSIQNTLQSLESKMPKIILQRVEKIYSASVGSMVSAVTLTSYSHDILNR